jgi:apolipoprotein N-acyltransferase
MYGSARQDDSRSAPLARPWVWLATLASAGLLWQTQPPQELGWLAPVALVPWLMATRGHDPTRAGLSAGMLGLLFGLAVSSWIPEALDVRGARHIPASFGWLLTSFWAGALPLGLLGASIQLLDRHGARVQIPACALLAFALDTLRSHVSAGIPWALLGHSQAQLPGVAQLAAVGGVPLLSALLVAMNLALARMLHPQRRPVEVACAVGCVAAWLALVLGGVPLAEALNGFGRSAEARAEPPLRALLARHRIRPEERWVKEIQRTQLAALSLHTERALRQALAPPDLILWPENTLTTPLDSDPELAHDLYDAVSRFGVDVVLGSVAAEPGFELDQAYRSVAIWVSPQSGVLDVFAKTSGVPLVESAATTPLEQVLRRGFGIPDTARALRTAQEQRPLRGALEVATALCYEVIYPGLVDARRGPGTRAIINPSSDAWLRDPSAVSAQLTAYGSFRAIEQRLPLLRISDAGDSVALDAFGRPRATLRSSASGGFLVEIQGAGPVTWLERAGLLLLPLGFGGLVALAFAWTQRRSCIRTDRTAVFDD